jgi:tetratricopeptide (TPR) repeat protein
MVLRVCLTSLLVGGASLSAGSAHADSSDEAGRHFEAGVQAFEEQRLGDAAGEFERAYELKPNWQVLYNLGSVYAALGRPVEAADAFERYLEQGVGSIAEDRKREVEAELARQRAKTGQLEITVNEPGAEVRVDTRVVGRSPLSLPVRVSSGSHVVDLLLDGRKPERREIVVSSQEHARVDVTLVPIVARRPSQPSPAVSPPAAPVRISQTAGTEPETASTGTGQRIAAYAVGGLGLVGVGVGIGIIAGGQSKHLDAVDLANAGHRSAAESLESDSDHQKTLGYATTGIGGALVLGGVVLLLSAPNGAPARVASHISPWVSASSRGFAVTGVF